MNPMHVPPLFVFIALTALESVLFFAAPGLLARLAFIPLSSERRIRLPMPKVETNDARYRGSAMVQPSPVLPQITVGRRDLDDAVLVQAGDGPSFMLRRAYSFIRRNHYLVRITMRLEGNEVVLRAKQAVVPLTVPLIAVGIGLDDSEQSGWRAAAFLLAFLVVAFGIQWHMVGNVRDRAIAEAFDAIEGAVRGTLAAGSSAPNDAGLA